MKKWLMRQYWRIQQSQAIIGLGFWTATITLLVWPYVSWRFESNETLLFIPMTYIGLIGIATTVLTTVLLAEEVQRYCKFVDRMLIWNSKEEIWARAMSSWKEIMGDEDPFLFYLDEESRMSLEQAADNLEDF